MFYMYILFPSLPSDAFAKLLESGELKMNSLKLEGITMPFHHLLAKICFHHHFSGTSCRERDVDWSERFPLASTRL